jgi:hypothetical protein
MTSIQIQNHTMKTNTNTTPVWLITGCSTGFGRSLVRVVFRSDRRRRIRTRFDHTRVSATPSRRPSSGIASPRKYSCLGLCMNPEAGARRGVALIWTRPSSKQGRAPLGISRVTSRMRLSPAGYMLKHLAHTLSRAVVGTRSGRRRRI